ncbi:MAG: metallophosphoesterase family protein [Candidatus Omnitrophota bacterium]
MKIGVISDTHIPVNCPEIPKKILKVFKDVEMILHAGDLIDYKVIGMLQKITPRVVAVCGNMDSHEACEKLAKKEILTVGRYKIGLIHGYGAADTIIETVSDELKNVDIIVFGHSHKPLNKKINGILYFNPGSATDKIFTKENTVGILNINDKIEANLIIV